MVDPEIQRIAQLLKEQGKTQADLGRQLGLDSSQMTRLFSGRRKLQLHEAKTALAYLGVAGPADLQGGQVVPGPGMIPLYGWTAPDHVLMLNDQCLVGYTPRHPAQTNMRAPFAVQVGDERMYPRYEPGEIAYVAPNKFPARYQDCLLFKTDGTAVLGRLKDRTPLAIVIEWLDGSLAKAFPRDEVQSVEAIVGRG